MLHKLLDTPLLAAHLALFLGKFDRTEVRRGNRKEGRLNQALVNCSFYDHPRLAFLPQYEYELTAGRNSDWDAHVQDEDSMTQG
jgi:hypothetical protein